jgi:hypothetical protein
MIVGDLVKLKHKYPIWLLSFGIAQGDMGLVTTIGDNWIEVYWIKNRRIARLKPELVEVVE